MDHVQHVVTRLGIKLHVHAVRYANQQATRLPVFKVQRPSVVRGLSVKRSRQAAAHHLGQKFFEVAGQRRNG